MELDLICPKEDCYDRLEQDGPANWITEKGKVSIPLVCPTCKSFVLVYLETQVRVH